MKIPPDRVIQEALDRGVPALSRRKLHQLVQRSNYGSQVFCTKLQDLGHDAQDITGTLTAMRACNIKAVCLEISPTLDLAGNDGMPIMLAITAYLRLLSATRGGVIRKGQERARAKGQSVGRRVELTEITQLNIRQHLLQGLSAGETAKSVGVSRWKVYRQIKRETLSVFTKKPLTV